jgi:SAM-dependent methyltransferase
VGVLAPDPATEAYAPLARHYDVLTGHYKHELWLSRLEALALECGLGGRRVLDIGCGTGKSLLPLARRGYHTTGCDISREMLDEAQRAVPADVELIEADMRALPELGPFDLVTCLDDAVNYLLGDNDLVAVAQSVRRVLAPGGLWVFDANSACSHATAFDDTYVIEEPDVFLCWHGHGLEPALPGRPGSATVEIFETSDGSAWERSRSEHRQRHWSREDVVDALAQAGLALLAVRGQLTGARLEPTADESRHNKIVYVAGRTAQREADRTRQGRLT